MGKSSSSKRVWNNVASYCQRVQIIRYVFFLNVLFINVNAFSHYILKIGVLRLALICLIASSYFTFCWFSCERIFIYAIDNKISLNQNEILEFLTDKINHSIGYYSIALTFQFKFKLRLLNPVWTVIVYDHKNPPSLKTILEIDALNLVLIGDVYTEEIIDA